MKNLELISAVFVGLMLIVLVFSGCVKKERLDATSEKDMCFKNGGSEYYENRYSDKSYCLYKNQGR